MLLLLSFDYQSIRMLWKGEAPAEKARKTVVYSLAAGILAGHDIVKSQVNLASGNGGSVHFGVQHGIVKQGREEHIRSGGPPGDAVPAIAGSNAETTALRLHAYGWVIYADGCPAAKSILFLPLVQLMAFLVM